MIRVDPAQWVKWVRPVVDIVPITFFLEVEQNSIGEKRVGRAEAKISQWRSSTKVKIQ